MSRTERADGSGDLVFEEDWSRDRHGHRQVRRRGFFAIAGVREVEDLVRKTLKVE
jgi:hypothetical protein